MTGRAFLKIAQALEARGTEPHWRAVAGRAYYGLMLEARDALQRWGFAMPPHHAIHHFVRLRFTMTTDAELKPIGYVLETLGRLRNEADYKIATPGPFADANRTQQAVQDAIAAVVRLDRLKGAAHRRAAAIAAIKAAFPGP